MLYWHGCNGHLPLLDYTLEISRVEDVASDRGYFAITPVGTEAAAGRGEFGWNADGIKCGESGVDDFAFFEALLDFAERELCVDLRRVYTIGFSTGAFLSYGIACRFPDRIAAAGANAGGLSRLYYAKWPTTLPQLAPAPAHTHSRRRAAHHSHPAAAPTRVSVPMPVPPPTMGLPSSIPTRCAASPGPVPMQSFHSLSDPTVPFNGSLLWASQREMDAMWRSKNGCDGTEAPRTTHNSSTCLCQRWDCAAAPVESCQLRDIDHCWYGGRSGGFESCKVRPGDVDATSHMFNLWEELV